MATSRVVIDPITRIEGHLKIEVQVTDGIVTDAWSSGTLFRGIETILKNRSRRMPGCSRSGCAASAPMSMARRRCAPWKTRSGSRSRPMPASSATS